MTVQRNCDKTLTDQIGGFAINMTEIHIMIGIIKVKINKS